MMMMSPRTPRMEAKMSTSVWLEPGQCKPALMTTASGRCTTTGTDVCNTEYSSTTALLEHSYEPIHPSNSEATVQSLVEN